MSITLLLATAIPNPLFNISAVILTFLDSLLKHENTILPSCPGPSAIWQNADENAVLAGKLQQVFKTSLLSAQRSPGEILPKIDQSAELLQTIFDWILKEVSAFVKHE